MLKDVTEVASAKLWIILLKTVYRHSNAWALTTMRAGISAPPPHPVCKKINEMRTQLNALKELNSNISAL